MVYLDKGKHLSAVLKRDAHRVRTALELRDRGARVHSRKAIAARKAQREALPETERATVHVPPPLDVPRFDPRVRHAMFSTGARS